MRSRTRQLLIALLATFALVAGACGDDSSDSAEEGAPPSTEATEDNNDSSAGGGKSDDDPTSDGDPTSGDDPTSDGDATSNGDATNNGDAVGTPDDCQLIAQAFADADVSVAGPDGTTEDPTEGLKAAAEAMRSLEDKVSADLRPHVTVLADVYATLADGASSIDWKALEDGDMSAINSPELAALFAQFNSEEVVAATTALGNFAMEHCANFTGLGD